MGGEIMGSVLGRFVGIFFDGSKQEAVAAVAEFCESIASLRRRYNLLNEYASAYYNTFNEAGWNDLTNLLEELTVTENALRVLIDARRYNDARDVAHFLLGKLTDDAAEKCVQKFEGLSQLADWKPKAQRIMLCVINTALEAAQKTKDLGVERGRVRKPTLLALAELRGALLD